MDKPQHIVISRTDNIGDVVLTLPMAALLKQKYPHIKVSFLARDYVKSIISACPDVDAFISWDGLRSLDERSAIDTLRDLQIDAIIHVFPQKKIAKLAKAAKINWRIGSSHRWYHWVSCNQRIDFSRKNSSLHEAQLNLQLLQPFNLPNNLTLVQLQDLLHLHKCERPGVKIKSLLAMDRFNLVLHPLTNGNTEEWPLSKFSALIKALPEERFNIIVSGTANEKERLQPLLKQYPNVQDAVGTLSLATFIDLLSCANGIVANSTGPMHLAAALGIHVLGLFPEVKGKDIGRWLPLGEKAEVLSAASIDLISLDRVLQIITNWQNESDARN